MYYFQTLTRLHNYCKLQTYLIQRDMQPLETQTEKYLVFNEERNFKISI